MKVRLEIELEVPDTGLTSPEVIAATHEHVLNAAYKAHLTGVIKSLGKPGHEAIVAVHRTWADIIDSGAYTISVGGETFSKP